MSKTPKLFIHLIATVNLQCKLTANHVAILVDISNFSGQNEMAVKRAINNKNKNSILSPIGHNIDEIIEYYNLSERKKTRLGAVLSNSSFIAQWE